jgi:ABC-2 type transport system ATP-binding protein
MIEVSGLTKCYGDFVAVRDLSFAVRPGEILGLVGPNGAGKTSALRCLAGIIPPSGGSIRISGHDLAAAPLEAKRAIAFFSDEPRLFEYLTLRQHLVFTGRLYGVADVESRIDSLLTELELNGKADELPGALSRGMKQKVAIACGLIHSPRVIFFDEPLTGLDPIAIRKMKDTIRRLAAEGAAMVISSHLLHLLEEVCTHVLVLKRGCKIAHGSLDEIRQQFAAGDASVDLEELFIRIASRPEPPEGEGT